MHIYGDGTVLVSHGGVEMGQGLHTKVTQVAAEALGVDLSQVNLSFSSSRQRIFTFMICRYIFLVLAQIALPMPPQLRGQWVQICIVRRRSMPAKWYA